MTWPFPPALQTFVFMAGALHFIQLPALLLYKKEGVGDASALSPMERDVKTAMTGGILLVVLGLGALVMANAGELVRGGRLACSLCFFLALFWSFRAAMQVTLFSKYFKNGWRGRVKYYGLLAILLTKVGIYLSAAFIIR